MKIISLLLQANTEVEKVKIFVALNNMLMSLDNSTTTQTVLGGVINLFGLLYEVIVVIL